MSLAYSIGTGGRSKLESSPNAKFVPGPGAYTPGLKRSDADAPKWGFGTSQRGKLQAPSASKNVGPGQYQIPQRAVEGPQYLIGQINHKIKKYGSISPGPGNY